jgi:quercetin dioxygenase-like cupin family protein
MAITAETEGYAIASDEGKALWMLGGLFTVKAGSAQTNGGFSLLEFHQPPGTEPPLHTHQREDEAFYVLDGEMAVVCGERRFTASPGSFVFLPRGVLHGFTIVGTTALRGLVLTQPGGFDEFVAEMGEPAKTRTIPAGGPPDLPKLLALAGKYGIDLQLPGA